MATDEDTPQLTVKDTLHRLVDLSRWPDEAEQLAHHAAIEREFGQHVVPDVAGDGESGEES